MAWKTRLLVVANRTADSDDLLAALRERAARGPIAVTLIVPQDSHGGLGEQKVPFMVSHALRPDWVAGRAGRPLRNFDIFDAVLNGAQA